MSASRVNGLGDNERPLVDIFTVLLEWWVNNNGREGEEAQCESVGKRLDLISKSVLHTTLLLYFVHPQFTSYTTLRRLSLPRMPPGGPFKGVQIIRPPGRDPKTHGHIPGVPVGAIFKNREECSTAGVHAPLQSGIAGNKDDGAFSVVLSGGYEDDEDDGYNIKYTGQGGKDRTGDKMDQLQGKTKWDGPQSSDQEWVRGNKALLISCQTGKPVRVIRGSGLNSKYAPASGYRYDGLYTVVKASREKGKEGYLMCRFMFKRQEGQPPLPIAGAGLEQLSLESIKNDFQAGSSTPVNDVAISEVTPLAVTSFSSTALGRLKKKARLQSRFSPYNALIKRDPTLLKKMD